MDAGVVGTCAAPYTSLRFEPDGRITICCINGQYTLGRAPEDSIAATWGGDRVARLRAAIDRADYSLGCHDCEQPYRQGRRHLSQAVWYDHLVGPDLGRWPQRLEFALSNTCNLRCIMCNGELSSSIRSHEGRPPMPDAYDERFFDELRSFLPHAHELTFLGGEPFLSRHAMRVWDMVDELGLSPHVHVTTNGTVLNDRVERYVRRLRMDLAISVDGRTPATFESIRVGADHAATMANCDRLRSIAREIGTEVTFNSCLMVGNWQELPDLLADAEDHGTYVNVIVVDFPKHLSLLRLPPEELRPVVDGFEARDAEMRSLLRINLTMWDRALARLREARDGGRDDDGGRDVTVPVSLTAGRAAAERRFRSSAEELAAGSDRRPVVIDVDGDLVRSVTTEDWASALALDDLVGTSLLRLLPELAHRLAFDPTIRLEEIGPGLTRSTVEATGAGWSVTISSVMAEWTDGDLRRTRVALHSRDDLSLMG